MILEILNLSVSAILTAAAIKIAHNSNLIAEKNTRLESDKLLIEWGQRTLQCLSEITSLRITPHTDITETEFKSSRRVLRSKLYALKEEGLLLFAKSMEQEPLSIAAIADIASLLDGKKFLPPKERDFDAVRSPQVNKIRDATRVFIQSLQEQIGTAWLFNQAQTARPGGGP